MSRRKGVNPENNPHNNLKQNQEKANENMTKRKQEMREKAYTKQEMTKEEKLKARKKAYKTWALSDQTATNIRLAEETGLTVHQIKHYKEKDKWVERFKKDQAEGKFEKIIQDKAKEIDNGNFEEEIDTIQDIFEENSLTERERLFVLHYLKSFNITQSAKEAGYAKASAHTKGKVILKREPVYNAVNEIRKLVSKNIMIDAYDIIQEYVKVAFADITDYVQFNGQQVSLRDSTQVDGTLISEVKQGRDGLSFKLHDKMRALERLEKLFEIMPDRKLELEQQKFQHQKELTDKAEENDSNVTIINDIGSG